MSRKRYDPIERATLRTLREPFHVPDDSGGRRPMLPVDVAVRMKPPTKREAIARLETKPGAIRKAKVETLERYLATLGYQLKLVAVRPGDGGIVAVDDPNRRVRELVDVPAKE